MKKSVLVGMSGGVDSSVSAALLQKRGFRVVGGFIKNWSDSKDVWTGECQWRGERRDAMRVAAKLGIPLLTFDFEKIYRSKVVKELFRGYATGVTPNPDVLCNEVVKFGMFLTEAKRLGFDYVATGHYVRVIHGKNVSTLQRGVDPEKDQSYFVYRVPQSALRMSLFPVGGMKKSRVRQLARDFGLPVAEKADSQGICFIGKLDMKTFLRKKIASKPGEIIDASGNVIGHHDGLDQFTIGQRHGIGLATGGKAWYVAAKNRKKRQLIVVPGDDHPLLYRNSMHVGHLCWTSGKAPRLPVRASVQVRYRQPPVPAILRAGAAGKVTVTFLQPVKAVAAGQSAVFYRGAACLGGGIILEDQSSVVPYVTRTKASPAT